MLNINSFYNAEVYHYKDCMDWATSTYHWSNIDAANKEIGFSSTLFTGAKIWTSAKFCILFATIAFYFTYLSVFAFSKTLKNIILQIGTVVWGLIIPCAFVLTVVGLQTIQSTDQLNPTAWQGFFPTWVSQVHSVECACLSNHLFPPCIPFSIGVTLQSKQWVKYKVSVYIFASLFQSSGCIRGIVINAKWYLVCVCSILQP